MSEPRIMVTGATGAVGSQALRILTGLGVPAMGIARNPQRIERAGVEAPYRIADYGDRDGLVRAFRGADQLLFVASDGKAEIVAQHHSNVVDAAVRAGMKRIIFTSIVDIGASSPFYFAPLYRETERSLRATDLRVTILRCNIFTDFIFENWCLPAAQSGRLHLPIAHGRLSPISRNDVAMAMAHAAIGPLTRSRYQLTGPKTISMHDVAGTFTDVTGLHLRYTSCGMDEYRSAVAELDAPWPQAFSSLCESIAAGNFGQGSGDFAQLTSVRPESFASALARLHRQWVGTLP